MINSSRYYRRGLSAFVQPCIICGSKSVGMNFGVLTCAPCKAFFRRNARRKELLELPCQHRDLGLCITDNTGYNERMMRYLQIRRCSSCRLRRCFEVGMREELIRTDEENERYRQLVDINRKRREMLKEQLQSIRQLSTPQTFVINNEFLEDADWSHLSNIVHTYETHCLKTFTQQRANMICNDNLQFSGGLSTNKNSNSPITCVVLAVSAFLKSLPAFYSLPRATRNYLCKTNTRPLICPSIYELHQSCYSEPWQEAAYQSTCEFMCGPQLYKQFTEAEKLAEKLWITDPIVTRLWIIVLFFSTPLHYHDDSPTPTPILKKKLPLYQTQNAYVTLLWKYLLHRHGYIESVRIYLNLIRVYLYMQSVGFRIYTYLKSKKELLPTHETLNRVAELDVSEDEKKYYSKKRLLA